MQASEQPTEVRFIEALVRDLEPVRPAAPWLRATASWYGVAGLWVAFGVLSTGPIRDGLGADLDSFRFVLELLLGAATSLALIAAGLETGVPGAPGTLRLLGPSLILGAAWLGLTFLPHGIQVAQAPELLGPLLVGPEPSMNGKRAHCFLQGLAIPLIPIALALASLRRRALYRPGASGFLIGLAAAAATAAWMQAACMYEPSHALRLHFSPMPILGTFAAVIALRLLRRAE